MNIYVNTGGVEALIITDNLKKWIKNTDYNNSGYVDFKISKVFKNIEFNYISIYNFNEIFKSLDYNKIFCFGNKIYLKSKNNYYLIISLSKFGYFSEDKKSKHYIMFKINDVPLYYNDILYFADTISFLNNENIPYNMYSQIKNSLEWRDEDAAFKFTRKCRMSDKRLNLPIFRCMINNRIIQGINDIYASESLFESKIPINKKIKDLHDRKIFEIISKCQEIMRKSYMLGGFIEKGRESLGPKGYGKKILKVYGKKGKLCENCKSGIIQSKKIKLSKNTFIKMYYCPICQSEKNNE
jgi:formamidopyrimidine-DNA glycosylase